MAKVTSDLKAAMIADIEKTLVEDDRIWGKCKAGGCDDNSALCCGTFTPKTNAAGVTTGQETGRCGYKNGAMMVPATIKADYTDIFGVEYTHKCGAKYLAAAGAMIATAIYM